MDSTQKIVDKLDALVDFLLDKDEKIDFKAWSYQLKFTMYKCALEKHRGNMFHTADFLNLNRTTLHEMRHCFKNQGCENISFKELLEKKYHPTYVSRIRGKTKKLKTS